MISDKWRTKARGTWTDKPRKSNMMISNVLYKLYWRLTANRWQIGFPQTSLEQIAGGGNFRLETLKGVPDDRWFADPFIVDVDTDHITLLVEEFLHSTGRGRLARLTVSRADYSLLQNDTLLDLDTHLSFPMIVRKQGKVYICPENSQSGKLNIYEYDAADGRCIPCGTMSEEPLVDAIWEEIDGDEYLFATQQPSPNGNKLEVYKKDDDGEYRHCQDLTFNDNIARNGGAFFRIDGKMYRPAQDCNGGYGRGLSIQQVTHRDGKFEMTETARIKSPRGYRDHGMHTLNEYKDVTVIDISSYRFPRIGSTVDALWQKLGWPIELK